MSLFSKLLPEDRDFWYERTTPAFQILLTVKANCAAMYLRRTMARVKIIPHR